ncbi:hypothetical protein [Gallibacterium anatis]|uniref:Uncharacterized protein n=2 Tax=Gallibacterium anatis TaxID=750 RepID=U1GJ84_9PAST|nr:hypothetical protein [Gallibacterium anatis]ERF77722.1 hypothetical protein N561_10290 [Gallibacterium anatis 12656/12]KGQ26692.1 hypothetical protein JP31_05955 [Gallibacterium anatis]KGQ50352.1 hypothetical protein JL04_04045 [Gallibacterium anatis]WIM82720.1 hypothetical protein QP019_03440 [Gallibacterium anatis]
MAKLIDKNWSIHINCYSQWYVDYSQTIENYYTFSINVDEKPIVIINDIPDFEFDDYYLSDVFFEAIETQERVSSEASWDGQFYLELIPHKKEDKDIDWEVMLEIGPYYFSPTSNINNCLKFSLFVTKENLMEFAYLLREEESKVKKDSDYY